MIAAMSRRWRGWLRAGLALALLWAVPAAVSAGQAYARLAGAGNPYGWWQLFLGQLPLWLAWVPITGIVVWLARRFPLRREAWARTVAIHSAAALGVGGLYHAMLAPLLLFQEGLGWSVESLRRAILGNFVFSALVDFLVYWVIVGVATAWGAHERLRDRELQAERLRAELNRARLVALRSQLQPHFLFNALHSVAGLIRQGEGDRAVGMLARLGDLLRRGLDRDERAEIPLHEEMETIERYLEIEELRFGDGLRVEKRLAPGTADRPVPPFLLQPLVENAMRHGIAARAGAGLLQIEARLHGADLVIEVRDDGAGVSAPVREGVGLGSTRGRLAVLHGEAARLELDSAPDGGAVARVTIPPSGARR